MKQIYKSELQLRSHISMTRKGRAKEDHLHEKKLIIEDVQNRFHNPQFLLTF